jgi:hypothetical protein
MKQRAPKVMHSAFLGDWRKRKACGALNFATTALSFDHGVGFVLPPYIKERGI